MAFDSPVGKEHPKWDIKIRAKIFISILTKKLCKFATHCIKCNNFNLVNKFLFNPTVLKVGHSVDP